MNFYQKHSCNQCHEPLWWDDDIRSERTCNRIPLNSDGVKHFTTCANNEYNKRQTLPQQQQQQPQQQQQQPQQPRIPVATHKEIPIVGPRQDDWETRLGLLNGELFQRLDRIDASIRKIAMSSTKIAIAMTKLAQYYERNEEDALKELRYDQDKEEGLV